MKIKKKGHDWPIKKLDGQNYELPKELIRLVASLVSWSSAASHNKIRWSLPRAVLSGAFVDQALVSADQEHGLVVGVERNTAAAI